MIENPTRQQNKHSFMCSSPHWNIQPRSLPYTLMITFIRCSSGVKSVIERKLSTVFPFGLNHSAKVSLNTSCFLYVSDRDVLFCFLLLLLLFLKALLQNETIQGFMKDYRCVSLNTPVSPPLCPCSFWDWGEKKPGWPFILLLHLFSGASFPFYVLNLQPSAGGTTFHSASVAERQQLWWLHWLLM